MRGDRPCVPWCPLLTKSFTPHARGSTPTQASHTSVSVVYPACAGIDLRIWRWLAARLRLPRMRGDRPPGRWTRGEKDKFTPHARGSTVFRQFEKFSNNVYPACAGIDPFACSFSASVAGLPRMRGDRPMWHNNSDGAGLFTPHARGSTDSR